MLGDTIPSSALREMSLTMASKSDGNTRNRIVAYRADCTPNVKIMGE